MPLLTAGFTQELIDVIHGAGIPAETIEDVISHKRIDFTHGGMTDAQVRAMRCVLINYGLTVEAEDKYKDRPKRGQGKKNTQEQTYEERKNEYKQIVCDYLAKKGQSSQQDDTTSNNSSERT